MKLRNEPNYLPQKQADLIFVVSDHRDTSQRLARGGGMRDYVSRLWMCSPGLCPGAEVELEALKRSIDR